jgi:hypothetical protein
METYNFVDSYEKALAFTISKLEKTNNDFIQNLDTQNLISDNYIYYLKYCCNIGIVINDFNFGFSFNIPFNQEYFLNNNGEFYNSIISSNHLTTTSEIPLPFFQSIFTYIPLSNAPDYINSLEKYIVWLSYQMQEGGSDINITHETNTNNNLSDFIIDSRNLKLFEKKSNYLLNAEYPQYDVTVNQAYLRISHSIVLDKNILFRFGNFSNSIVPEINKNPQIKYKTFNKSNVYNKIAIREKHTRIFKPLNIKHKNSTVYQTLKNKYYPIKRQFGDFAFISNFSSIGGYWEVNWKNETTFASNHNFVKYQFSWIVSTMEVTSQGGKLDSRWKSETQYYTYSTQTTISKKENTTTYKILKNYIYKNLIEKHR